MDTGSSAFILICSAMVCLMTPALAFFYGGLGRRKNVINTMMMSVLPLAIASLLWIVAGYSLSLAVMGISSVFQSPFFEMACLKRPQVVV